MDRKGGGAENAFLETRKEFGLGRRWFKGACHGAKESLFPKRKKEKNAAPGTGAALGEKSVDERRHRRKQGKNREANDGKNLEARHVKEGSSHTRGKASSPRKGNQIEGGRALSQKTLRIAEKGIRLRRRDGVSTLLNRNKKKGSRLWTVYGPSNGGIRKEF